MKAKSKQQIAQEYFPDISIHSATNRLSAWINKCKPLLQKLEQIGYTKNIKLLSPPQVSLVYEYLGEP